MKLEDAQKVVDKELRGLVESVAPEDRDIALAMVARTCIDALGRIEGAERTLLDLVRRANRAAECGTTTERELFFGKAGR